MSKKAPLFSAKYFLHDILKWFMSWQLMLWYRVKIMYDGEEAKKHIKGGAIVICNHVGFSDPFIVQCTIPYRRFYFLAAKEMFKSKFSNWWYRKVFLSEPVDREKPSLATVRYCSNVAKRGNLLCLFPEGHIVVNNGELDSFKGGAVLMAYMADAPIIPLYHEKRKSIWNMTRMVIGKPFYVKEIIGAAPTQTKIQEASNLLAKYELELKEINDRNKKKN